MPRTSSAPVRTVTGALSEAARPATVSGTGAPVTATSAVRSARSRSPPAVVSTVAASGRLPTSRLARSCAARSAAPERGTPIAAQPGRPASCTVASGPVATTRSTSAHLPQPNPGTGAQQRRRVAVDVEQDRVGAADQLPATGRGAGGGAGERAGQADRPGRDTGARGTAAGAAPGLGAPGGGGGPRGGPAPGGR